jgi:hypothetical protein
MSFTLQAAGPILHWFTLIVLFAMPIAGGFVLYKLGALPGSIAASRQHPQATAINVCGWMGIVTLVLWPIALIWAHMSPRAAAGALDIEGDGAAPIREELRKASQRLAAIESTFVQGHIDGAGHR